VVSFRPWPLYTRGKSPRYTLDKRLGRPRSRSGRQGIMKILGPTGTRGQSGTGAGFLQVFRFPLPILIPPNAPYSSLIRTGTIGQLVTDVPSGFSLTPPQETNKNSGPNYGEGPIFHKFVSLSEMRNAEDKRKILNWNQVSNRRPSWNVI
jgi:hypothetical protein